SSRPPGASPGVGARGASCSMQPAWAMISAAQARDNRILCHLVIYVPSRRFPLVIVHYSDTNFSSCHGSTRVHDEGREEPADAVCQPLDGVVLPTIRNSIERTITLVGRSPGFASTRDNESGTSGSSSGAGCSPSAPDAVAIPLRGRPRAYAADTKEADLV